MTDDLRRITRALISVSDKTGAVEFARVLAARGIEIVSTGGTRKALSEAGLAVLDVSELTGFPEMMDGRVKTLHPNVHGGLLAIRGNAEHAAAMAAHGIRPIDLLVVNLYPFEDTVARGADYDTAIENIDIGGPAMIRAAAKNHGDVAVVVEPQDYAPLLAELTRHDGMTSLKLRQGLAAKAYARTAAYDAAISNWFAATLEDPAPAYRTIGGRLIEALRYGENPHQSAAFYRAGEARPGVATARQVQGKQLSYNNINDTDAAYECVAEFDPRRTAACALIKHANPCGVAGDCASLIEEKPTRRVRSPATRTLRPSAGSWRSTARARRRGGGRAPSITEIFTEGHDHRRRTASAREAIAVVAAKKNLRRLLLARRPARFPRGTGPGGEIGRSPAGCWCNRGATMGGGGGRHDLEGGDQTAHARPRREPWPIWRSRSGSPKHVKSNTIVYAGDRAPP